MITGEEEGDCSLATTAPGQEEGRVLLSSLSTRRVPSAEEPSIPNNAHPQIPHALLAWDTFKLTLDVVTKFCKADPG